MYNKIMKLKISPHKGFTLAELLIVIAIIAILGILILLTLNPLTYFKRAYDTERKDDIYKIKTALESYYADNEYYPNLEVILADCDGDSLRPYLDKVPCDPTTRVAYESYTLPVGSTKPQHYVIYAPTTSVNFTQANIVPQCPNTLIISSPGLTTPKIIEGCPAAREATFWGCKSGACVPISWDETTTCFPNYSTSDCGDHDCNQEQCVEFQPTSPSTPTPTPTPSP